MGNNWIRMFHGLSCTRIDRMEFLENGVEIGKRMWCMWDSSASWFCCAFCCAFCLFHFLYSQEWLIWHRFYCFWLDKRVVEWNTSKYDSVKLNICFLSRYYATQSGNQIKKTVLVWGINLINCTCGGVRALSEWWNLFRLELKNRWRWLLIK